MVSKTFNFTLYLTPHGGRDDPHYYLTDSNMEPHGYLPIQEVPVTVQLPDPRGLVDKRVQALDRAEQRLRAEFHARVTELQRQKNELLAIENTVDA